MQLFAFEQPPADPTAEGGVREIVEDEDLSLSRLNHRLPGGKTHPEVMQGTAQFHDQIADTLLPQADAVFYDTAALDAAVDMLDPQPPVVQGLVGQVLFQGECLATGFLG